MYIPWVGSKELRAAENGDIVKKRTVQWMNGGSQQKELAKAAHFIGFSLQPSLWSRRRSLIGGFI